MIRLILLGLCCLTVDAASSLTRLEAAQKADERPAVSPLLQNVEGMFEEGYTVGPKHLQAAQKRFAAARALSPDDRRLDYAWGLVLLRHSQPKQAVAQFETATTATGPEGWLAWQALIWSYLVDRQYEKGLGRLDLMAKALQKSVDDSEITESHRETARWIGEALEAVDRTVQSKALHDLVARHAEGLKEILAEELYDSVMLGRAIVEDREVELKKHAGLENEANEKKDAALRETKADKLANELEEIVQEKASTAKSAEDWKKWRDEAVSKVDKQIDQLERDYGTLEKRSQTLQDSIINVGRDLTLLDVQAGAVAGNPGLVNIQLQQKILQKQNQMVALQVQYNTTIGQLSRTAQQGRGLQQQKNALIQKYEKATGDLQKKTADLDRWTTRLNDKKQKLEVKPAGKGKGTKAVAASKGSPLTFKSYLPLDLDAERVRIMDAIISAAEPDAPPAPGK